MTQWTGDYRTTGTAGTAVRGSQFPLTLMQENCSGVSQGTLFFTLILMIGCQARQGSLNMRLCPSCGSSRVRSGYRPAPFSLRLIGFRELLCDNCNYLYRAFSPIPPKHPRRSSTAYKREVRPAPAGVAVVVAEVATASKTPIPPRAPASPTETRAGRSHLCPHCKSRDTQRRRRRFWERLRFLSDKRPYVCNDCGRSFFTSTNRHH